MAYGYITDHDLQADPEWKNLTLTRTTCKECKHNPSELISDRRHIIISTPCPYHITDDPYYSWALDDDWFCANFEGKEESA